MATAGVLEQPEVEASASEVTNESVYLNDNEIEIVRLLQNYVKAYTELREFLKAPLQASVEWGEALDLFRLT